jgi:50S ribosomal protein L16 3-hydroxylase
MSIRGPDLRIARDTLLGMAPAEFLHRYWQRKPLLVRQAFPGFESPITPDDLAGLACEPMASARLAIHNAAKDTWKLRHGPFRTSDFRRLPKRDWTLLVQDCDKLLAEIDELLLPFRFVPDWRVDDVMASYAVDGGSVGAHVDQYDVFLLQAWGRRRWMISEDRRAPMAVREGVDLKLLREFTPTADYVLEPGDMLYLPPGVPHHGIAVGECMTFSIGMRAPSAAELLLDFAEHVAERLGEERRYADRDLAPAKRPAEIGAGALRKVRHILRESGRLKSDAFRDWYARFITRYRAAHAPTPGGDLHDAGALKRRVHRDGVLHRSPWSRYAWIRRGHRAAAYLAGDRYDCSLLLARILETGKRYDAATLRRLTAPDWRALAAMHNAGHLVFEHD